VKYLRDIKDLPEANEFGAQNQRVLEMGSRRSLGKLKPVSELTEREWIRELEHIDRQLTHVLDVFNFLEEIFGLSNESEAALGASIQPRCSGTSFGIACKSRCLWD
jgi:hypothetical protein